MKRFFMCLLVLVLALSMILPLASCTKVKPEEQPTQEPDDSKDPSQVGYVDDGKIYSYRMAPSDLPESWNYHTYQSNSSTYVLNYSSDTLYTFEYNKDFSGFEIVPSMAASFPVDVTSQYVGKFGIEEGDENKAYQITLKDNLKFDNGETLNARSFEESMKLLLDPQAANSRASDVYQTGNMKIYNAENYVKQNKYGLTEFVSANYGDDEYVDPSKFTTAEDGRLQYQGKDIVLDLTNGGNWGSELSLYADYGYLDIPEVDEATGRYKIVDKKGNWVLTVAFGEDSKTFYDLQGNVVECTKTDDGLFYGEVAVELSYVISPAYAALEAAADDNGWVKLTATTLKAAQDCIAMLHGYDNVEAYAAKDGAYAYQEFEEMAFFGYVFDGVDYKNVGFFALDDLNLVVVLKNPMANNFYFKYEMCTSFFLVYPKLYKELIKIEDGLYTNSYGTDVDTYVGYGPYKLTQYVEGAKIVLERNLYWHGYAAGEYQQGTYMTDRVVYNKVTNDDTRLEMFLKGEIDSYGLLAKDMKDYLGSDYTYFTDSESTWYLAMNPGMANLQELEKTATPVTAGNTVNKTVLTIEEFRQALSYSLNRTEFNQALSPTSGVAKALLSAMIVADPDSGLSYRSLDEAKDAILEFWGLSDAWGEGKEYATRDEAIDSITGFDPSGAKTLFTAAYNKAVKDNLIPADAIASGKWEVQIVIGKPSDAGFYNNGYEFLKTCWTNAVVGTPFEGHLAFVQSQTLGSTTFGDYLRNGQIDLLFGVGYGGSTFDPYSMMTCFADPKLEYDGFTDKKNITLDIKIDGKVLRASLYDWLMNCLQGDAINAKVVGADGEVTKEVVSISAGVNDPVERRITILAATECKVLTLSNIFPLMTDASAQLRCMRVNYKTEEYILGMGFGGVEWYTYAMDDAEFANYVSTQPGGVLNYK